MANIEEKVEQLLKNKIELLGYSLYDIEYVKEVKDYFLRIYIDNEKGITLEDCETVSNSVSDILDETEIIPDQYFLEVSSPGIERILKKEKHLQENINSKVQIKLFKPLDAKKQYIGILKEFNQDYIVIETDEKVLNLERKNIAQIRLSYDW